MFRLLCEKSKFVTRKLASFVAMPSVFAAALGTLIAIAVGYGWLNGHWIFFLDWALGPHMPLPPAQLYGLHGGLVTSLVLSLLVTIMSQMLGGLGSVLPILLVFPLAAVAVSSMVGRSWKARVPAILLYCVNPFVYDRLYVGQAGVLLGYAILPFVISSFASLATKAPFAWAKAAFWWTVIIACSPHYLWISGVPLVAIAFVAKDKKTTLRNVITVVILTFLTTVYVMIAGQAGGIGVRIGTRNLLAFRTTADSHFGLLLNLLDLYGFWRAGPILAKNIVVGWPLFLLAILAMSAYGVFASFTRSRRSESRSLGEAVLSIVLVISGIVGLFLAMGSQGPTGQIFRLAYYHIPFFTIMREPQKFLALTALAEATCFGWGSEVLINNLTKPLPKRVLFGVFLLIPMINEPLMFGGLTGQALTSAIPNSWEEAQSVMGSGYGRILALPWHQYLEYPFTQGRVVSNPSADFFTRYVISGDNIQLPSIYSVSTSPQSAYLEFLIANGSSIDRFGSLISSLGIKFILLEKTADFQSYSWLNGQLDLRRIIDSKSVEVFRNLDYTGTSEVTRSVIQLPNWGSLIAFSHITNVSRFLVLTHKNGPGPITLSVPRETINYLASEASKALGAGSRASPVMYHIVVKYAGWVQIDNSYSSGWKLLGRSPIRLAAGNMGWRVPAGFSTAYFQPWKVIVGGYVISFFTVLFLSTVILYDNFRSRRYSRSRRFSWLVLSGRDF